MRAAYLCSFRGCQRLTSGPSDESPEAVSMTGKAAHIHAAASGPGAKRYLASMTPQERSGISNGIWLCAFHADLIDKDEATYPPARRRDNSKTATDYRRIQLRFSDGVSSCAGPGCRKASLLTACAVRPKSGIPGLALRPSIRRARQPVTVSLRKSIRCVRYQEAVSPLLSARSRRAPSSLRPCGTLLRGSHKDRHGVPRVWPDHKQ